MAADLDRIWNAIDGIREDQSKTRVDIASIKTMLEGHCKDEDDMAKETKKALQVAQQARGRSNVALSVLTALGIPSAWYFVAKLFDTLTGKAGG